jgi:RNA polymerase sigma factor (sigma-70 family)
MPTQTDTLEIDLLRTNRNAFILQCQRIIELVIKQYIKTGMFRSSRFQDTVQSVNVALIKRLDSIEKNYNGSVLLNTYMNVVIRNICLRLYEQERSAIETEELTDAVTIHDHGHLNALLIQDEIRRFSRAMQMFGEKRAKIIICFKIYYRIPLTGTELRSFFDTASDKELAQLEERFGGNYDETLEIDNFNFIVPLMNVKEQNSTTGSSLRRWTLEYISRMISLMNGTPPLKAHTKETIRTLFEQHHQ